MKVFQNIKKLFAKSEPIAPLPVEEPPEEVVPEVPFEPFAILFRTAMEVFCRFVTEAQKISDIPMEWTQLVQWYQTTDWNDPVPMDPKYREIVERVDYSYDPETGISVKIPDDVKDEYADYALAYGEKLELHRTTCLRNLLYVSRVIYNAS
jgi:hypothetical protein